MNPMITIIAEGKGVKELKVESALESVEGFKLKKIGQDRSLMDVGTRVFTWVAEFVGSSTRIADALIEQATKELAGATVKLKAGDIEIEINNANRSQIAELLDKAARIAKEGNDL